MAKGNSGIFKKSGSSELIPILDLFHVNERTAAHCFHAETSPEAEQFVGAYLRMLLEGKVDRVIRSFRQLLKCASDGRETQTAPGHHYVLRQQPTAYAVR